MCDSIALSSCIGCTLKYSEETDNIKRENFLRLYLEGIAYREKKG